MLCPLDPAPLRVDEATGTGLAGADVGMGAGAGIEVGSDAGGGAWPDPPPRYKHIYKNVGQIFFQFLYVSV